MTIASPPPRGVGNVCELLSLGISIILYRLANFLIIYVNINEINPKEIANAKILFKTYFFGSDII